MSPPLTDPVGLHMARLRARIRAALRLVLSPTAPTYLRLGDLRMDFAARTVQSGAAPALHLTPKELDLLRYFTQHTNQALSGGELLQAVWGPDYGGRIDCLRAVVESVRRKIEPNPEQPTVITTVLWIGYRFNGDPVAED